MLALVLITRLVELGIHELAGDVDHAAHRSAHRRAVNVHIEHAHENRNAGDRPGRKSAIARTIIDLQFRWRFNHFDQHYQAISRRNNRGIALRHHAFGITEKREHPRRQQQQWPTDQLPIEREQKKQAGRNRDQTELAPFRVDRGPVPHRLAPAFVIEDFTCHRCACRQRGAWPQASRPKRNASSGLAQENRPGRIARAKAANQPGIARREIIMVQVERDDRPGA